MIRPMSKKRRMIMLSTLILIFFVVGPVLLLMASGYSFKEIISLTKVNLQGTGGIYVSDIGTDTTVFLDNKEVGRSSFLDRSVLVQQLSPKIHTLKVQKPGFREWTKKVSVLPKKVTEINPVLIAEKVSFEKINDKNSIKSITEAFSKKTEEAISTSSGKIVFDNGGIEVKIFSELVKLKWSDMDEVPQFMCFYERCDDFLNISITESVKDVEWFKNSFYALVIVSNDRVYLVELDSREGRITTLVFTAADFKVITFNKPQVVSWKGKIYLKSGNNFYLLNFDPISV